MRQTSGGFTLIEVLFAMSLAAVVVAIIYESFAAVTDATSVARQSAEELRIRQFLTRSFESSFSTVYVDLGFYNDQFAFTTASETGGGGAMDSVEFCSSAPLMGGMAPPGFFKRVHYGAAPPGTSDMTLGRNEPADLEGLSRSTVVFEATETLVAMTAPQPDQSEFSKDTSKQETAAAFGLDEASPAWTAPIAALDFSFFDGEEWVEDWDSVEMGRLPWCVRIRLNFARTEEQADAGDNGTNVTEDPDFEMYIPIPMGVGVWTPADQWLDAAGYGAYYGATNDNSQANDNSNNTNNGNNSANGGSTRKKSAGS